MLSVFTFTFANTNHFGSVSDSLGRLSSTSECITSVCTTYQCVSLPNTSYSRYSQHVPQYTSGQPQYPDFGVPPLLQNLLHAWDWVEPPEQPAPPHAAARDTDRLRLCVPALPHGWLHLPHADHPPQTQLTAEHPRRRRRRRPKMNASAGSTRIPSKQKTTNHRPDFILLAS